MISLNCKCPLHPTYDLFNYNNFLYCQRCETLRRYKMRMDQVKKDIEEIKKESQKPLRIFGLKLYFND